MHDIKEICWISFNKRGGDTPFTSPSISQGSLQTEMWKSAYFFLFIACLREHFRSEACLVTCFFLTHSLFLTVSYSVVKFFLSKPKQYSFTQTIFLSFHTSFCIFVCLFVYLSVALFLFVCAYLLISDGPIILRPDIKFGPAGLDIRQVGYLDQISDCIG